jgi:hypothetical protein
MQQPAVSFQLYLSYVSQQHSALQRQQLHRQPLFQVKLLPPQF